MHIARCNNGLAHALAQFNNILVEILKLFFPGNLSFSYHKGIVPYRLNLKKIIEFRYASYMLVAFAVYNSPIQLPRLAGAAQN